MVEPRVGGALLKEWLLAEWKRAMVRSNKLVEEANKAGTPVEFGVTQMLKAEQHNYDEALQRYRCICWGVLDV